MEPTSTGKLTVVSEDVLYYLMKKLSFEDLLTCRLVNKLWCANATSILKWKTKTVKLDHYDSRRQSTRVEKFARCILNADQNRPLPFGKFTFDFSREPMTSCPFIKIILDKIKTEKCYELRIKYTEVPKGSAEDQKICAMSRQGCMSFAHLEKLVFKLTTNWKKFEVEYLNMSELLQQSQGIRMLDIRLGSNCWEKLEEKIEDTIVCNVFAAITSPHNNFRWLSSLGISHKHLNEDHLRILAEWNHPLARLALGTFDVKTEKHPFPSPALHDILARRSHTLKCLRIQISTPRTSVAKKMMYRDNRNRVTFPVMRSLESLEIKAEGWMDISWALKLNENSFPEHFPKLKKFRLVDFRYSVGDFCREFLAFLPDLSRPSLTVEEVCLPEPQTAMDYNPVLMCRMLSLFPNVRTFEMNYSRKAVKTVFSSMPTLEKLVLRITEDRNSLDEALTGVPDRVIHEHDLSDDEALVYDIESRQVAPNISMLENLQELYLKAEDSVGISDVTAYRVLMKMEKFCRLTVETWSTACPDDDVWSFSRQCVIAMKPRIQLSRVQLWSPDNFLSFKEGRIILRRFW